MKSLYSLVYLALFVLVFSGCTLDRISEADPGCKYTSKSFTHVEPRHCDLSRFTSKSKFDQKTTVYCNGLKGGQLLCDTVQSAPDRRTVQPDGLICYDKDMGVVIGTDQEKWARVVVRPDSGEVVTQFPEKGAGCRS